MLKAIQIFGILLLATVMIAPHASYASSIAASVDQAVTIDTNITSPTDSFTTNEYMREGDKIKIDYDISSTTINDSYGTPVTITGGKGTITLDCVGDTEKGGWEISEAIGDGVCWTEQEYTRNTTINGQAVIEHYTLPASDLHGDGIDHNTINMNVTPISLCTGSAIGGAQGDVKRFCTFGNSGLIADTGDDMFRLNPGGKGILEYLSVTNGSFNNLNAKNRLAYFRRTGGFDAGIMIPAGPAGTYEDYHDFIKNFDSSIVERKKACFKAEISLCDANPTPTRTKITCQNPLFTWNEATQTCDAPPEPPECGTSHNQRFSAIPTTGLCRIGTASAITGDGPWNWSCNVGETQTQSCTALDIGQPEACPDGTILAQGVVPSEQTCRPTSECFLHVSGGRISGTTDVRAYSRNEAVRTQQIGDTTILYNIPMDSLVGVGRYPESSPFTGYSGTGDSRNANGHDQTEHPFLYADATTFDAMALGKDTHVKIYSDRNFEGEVIFEGQGPLVMNNVHWLNKGDNPQWHATWQIEEFPEPFQEMFPTETRVYSSENMQPWGRGTSVEVTCDAPPPASQWININYRDSYFDDANKVRPVCEAACEKAGLTASPDHNGATCASGNIRPQNADGSAVSTINFSHGTSGSTQTTATKNIGFTLRTSSYGSGNYQQYCIPSSRDPGSWIIRDKYRTVACHCEG